MRKIGGYCSRDDCNLPFYGKGLCRKHYDQARNLARSEELAAHNREYYGANRDRILAYKAEYRANNPEPSRKGARVRRARKHGGKLASYTEVDVLLRYGTKCHLCGEEIDLAAPRRTGVPGWKRGLHIDHNVGLALGGDDNIENVRPAHGGCNLTKSRR